MSTAYSTIISPTGLFIYFIGILKMNCCISMSHNLKYNTHAYLYCFYSLYCASLCSEVPVLNCYYAALQSQHSIDLIDWITKRYLLVQTHSYLNLPNISTEQTKQIESNWMSKQDTIMIIIIVTFVITTITKLLQHRNPLRVSEL